MVQPNESVGDRKELVLYRLQTAKGNLKSYIEAIKVAV